MKKASIAINQIVWIVIAVIVLITLVIVFSGMMEKGTKSFDELTPAEQEVSIASCASTCSTTKGIASSYSTCDDFENSEYCNKCKDVPYLCEVTVDTKTCACLISKD